MCELTDATGDQDCGDDCVHCMDAAGRTVDKLNSWVSTRDLIAIHLRASGPCSFESICRWLLDQDSLVNTETEATIIGLEILREMIRDGQVVAVGLCVFDM